MNQLYRFFRSVRLAVVLLLVITLLSILATLVPQGKGQEFYRTTYAPGLASLILAVGFDRFQASLLYLAPVVLFIGSLGVCTVDRLLVRHRGKAARRYGPDLIHIGLLVLAVGGVGSALLRREAYFTVAEGSSVDVTGGYRLELLSFEYLRYPDGRPKDYISTVRVTRGDKVVKESYPIEVNRPLRLGLLAIYQSNYETLLHLSDKAGAVYSLSSGGNEWVPVGDAAAYLAGAERGADGKYAAVFDMYQGEKRVDTRRIGAGESIGEYRIDQVSELTGLTASRDPGFIAVLAAMIIAGAGLALTFIQKRKEENP
jgi:hypothetical protein